jgi:predicted amidohydrolase
MLGKAAARGQMWIAGGSVPERDGDHLFNTAPLFDRSGELVARYRKIHLFDVDLEGQPPFRESTTYRAGTELVTHATEDLRVGLSICYDLRFPELYRILALRGARIITIPAAFTRVTGEAHWEILLRARAIENQVFVIAPGQGRLPGPDRDSYGNSMIVDPWGEVLARAGGKGACFVAADLDLARQEEIREKLPSLANRVAAAYRWPEEVRA